LPAKRTIATAGLSGELGEVLEPLLREIESLNERIQEYDERMEKIAKEGYPEVSLLKQVKGVGTQIALTCVLTIEDPHRFLRGRTTRFQPRHRTVMENNGKQQVTNEPACEAWAVTGSTRSCD